MYSDFVKSCTKMSSKEPKVKSFFSLRNSIYNFFFLTHCFPGTWYTKRAAPPSAGSNWSGGRKMAVKLLNDRKFHQQTTRTNTTRGKKEGGSGVGRSVLPSLLPDGGQKIVPVCEILLFLSGCWREFQQANRPKCPGQKCKVDVRDLSTNQSRVMAPPSLELLPLPHMWKVQESIWFQLVKVHWVFEW